MPSRQRHCRHTLATSLLASFAAALATTESARAIKPFSLLESGYPERFGQLELENSFSAAYRTREDHNFQNYSLENELEYGIADNFTLRGKVSYFYEDTTEHTGMRFDAAGVEGQIFFTNPNIDWVGISWISAFEIGESTLTNENFLVVQKDTDRWILAYNLGINTEVEGVFHDDTAGATTVSGSIVNAAGVMYSFTPTFRAGVEASAESAFDNWSHYAGTTVFAGPVINWIPNNKLWVTVGFDVQLTDTADEPKYLLNVVVGYYF
jgi:hypothetical protein